ncbi:MAG: efflux RND transporter periplasmic adaptor subunit [Gammaproteobacteria bacterium]|nr:efflux RND transporter periplasmic adaptor subunit [Gammaproteobacteria bacterium]
MTEHRNFRRMLLVVPPIVIGALVLVFVGSNRGAPTKVENGEAVRAVRTVEVSQVDLVPRAEGYGVVQPARIWRAVSQVSGRIVHMHPRLRDGEIIAAGTELLRIDPVDYQLSLAQIKAELAELDVQQQNNEGLLEIEERNLELAQRESRRLESLARQGTSSRSDADAAARAVLNSRTAVQNLRNAIALLPSRREVLEARLAQAERDLANTTISAPFNLRIAGLTVETDQYASAGQTLFQGDDVDRVEIIAQVALSSLRNLFAGRENDAPSSQQLGDGLADYAGLDATIHMDLGSQTAQWDARFVRFNDNVDSTTRTIGVVVAVDRPLDKVRPGQRPPLSKGMFVSVMLYGRVQPGRLVIPRSAVRAKQVMLVDADNRLQMQPVETLYTQDSLAIIGSGVEAGQRLVVSDLVPAVAGMRLLPQTDHALQTQLLQAAGGTR